MAGPSDWLAEAEHDLAVARKLVDQHEPKHACFNAQQAAEKALKAILLKVRGRVPKVHNLSKLLSRILAADPAFPDFSAAAKTLSPYYTYVRYPDLRAPGAVMPVIDEARDACRLAEEIVAAARARIMPPAPPPPPAPAPPAAP